MEKKGLRKFIIFVFVVMLIVLVFYVVYNMDITEIGDTVIETDAEGIKHTYVYVGAQSAVYTADNATTSECCFIENFNTSELATLIDSNGFPYKLEYTAITTSASTVRYFVRTDSGTTYWIEP